MNNKLIYVQWTNNFGGLERITADYERLFDKSNPIVLALKYKAENIQYKSSIKLNQKSIIILYLQYMMFVIKNRSAIFHLQAPGTLILLLTYFFGCRKIVYHFHGTMFSHYFFEKLIWKFLSKKIKIIANSNHTKDMITGKLEIEKNISVIPNFINTNYYRFSKRNPVIPKFLITYAGRFTKGKNIDMIVETAKCLLKFDQNIEVKLFGDGPEKHKVKSLIEKYDLKEKVKIPGFTNEMTSVYKNAHLFLFLSSHESFGNVVAEAVLSGTPILCYKIPALYEMINDDLFFINYLDPEEIADKILFMKNNYRLINDRLQIVYCKLLKYLDNSSITENLQSIYNNYN